MTHSKNTFIQHHKYDIVFNYRGLPIIDYKPFHGWTNDSIRRGNNALDPRYIMYITGHPDTLTDGSIESGQALSKQIQPDDTITILFVPTKEEALKLMKNPVHRPDIAHQGYIQGYTIHIPTTQTGFTAWCSKRNIVPSTSQRVPHFDPMSIGIKAPKNDYYWVEIPFPELSKAGATTPEQINVLVQNVPHRIMNKEEKVLILLKSGGQYKPKKQLLIEKALDSARILRTEESARFYVELFLQHPVLGVDISDVNWTAPDLGMQLVTRVTTINKETEKEVEDGGMAEDTVVSGTSSYDF